jgi:hypothetical protein
VGSGVNADSGLRLELSGLGDKPSSLEAYSRGGGARMPGTGEKTGEIPRDKRRGKLRNGNPSGDFSKAPRCGAKNRRGTACQCPAMRNGRCRLHGGLSTGPKTPGGLDRIKKAATKHGRYSQQARREQRHYQELLRSFRAFLNELDRSLFVSF